MRVPDEMAASELFELRSTPPSLGDRLRRWGAVVASTALLEGHGLRSPGGTSVTVVDRRTGRTICSLSEGLDGGDGDAARMVADFHHETADVFLSRWGGRHD